MSLSDFPAIDASLNAITAFLLTAGYFFIKRKNVSAHKTCMIGAVLSSTLFLVFYLYYHAHHGTTRFAGQGFMRPLYFTILISHTILAVVQIPFIVMTLVRAFQSRFEKHRAIARITLPIWLYVSVTGVLVYLLLYRSAWVSVIGV